MSKRKKTNFRRLISFFLISILSFFSLGPAISIAYADESEEKIPIPTFNKDRLESKSAYLINADNGKILYAHNENEKLVPASLTKIMTLLIANDLIEEGKLSLTEKVHISEKAWRTGGSKMWLLIDTEEYTVEELIQGVAVISANDGSVALAEHIAGSTDDFVKLMNKKAKELGMNDTTFETVNGLPLNGKKDLTTAKDLAALASHYINTYPDMLKIHSLKKLSVKQYQQAGVDNAGKQKFRELAPIEQENNNTLLGDYEGMDGLKTGFADYYNFIGTAKRGENRLIVVTIGSKNATARMNTASALLDYGFSLYKTLESGKKGDVIETLTVYKAEGVRETEVILKDDVVYGIDIRDYERVKIENNIPDYLEGGLKNGDKIGEQVVSLDDNVLAKSDIIITEDLHKTNWFVSIFHQIALWFVQLLNKISDIF